MSRPVSILVWRDAKTDPPPTKMERILVVTETGEVMEVWSGDARFFLDDPEECPVNILPRYWAPKPVVSDLTDDDVRDVASDSDYVADLWKRHGLPHAETRARADRLRAALGGEKEET